MLFIVVLLNHFWMNCFGEESNFTLVGSKWETSLNSKIQEDLEPMKLLEIRGIRAATWPTTRSGSKIEKSTKKLKITDRMSHKLSRAWENIEKWGSKLSSFMIDTENLNSELRWRRRTLSNHKQFVKRLKQAAAVTLPNITEADVRAYKLLQSSFTVQNEPPFEEVETNPQLPVVYRDPEVVTIPQAPLPYLSLHSWPQIQVVHPEPNSVRLVKRRAKNPKEVPKERNHAKAQVRSVWDEEYQDHGHDFEMAEDIPNK